MPFRVIEGHRFWYQSKARMRLSIKVVNTMNLHPISQSYREIIVKLSLMTGRACLPVMPRSERILPYAYLTTTKFGVKKLQTSLLVLKNVWSLRRRRDCGYA